MPKMIFIRHSQTKLQADISSHTWTLTDVGRERCAKLAEALRPTGLARLITSEEHKAMLTAQLTAEHLGIPYQSAPNLGETKRDNVPFYPDVADFRQAIRQAMAQPDKLLFGEETFTDARVRFAQQVDSLSAQYPDDTLAIVTHGTVLALYLAHLTAQDIYPLWESFGLPMYVEVDTQTGDISEIVNIE